MTNVAIKLQPVSDTDTDEDLFSYVVQEHCTDPHHYDLMFERDGVLWTWSLPQWQASTEHNSITGIKNADHRMKYLDYEGEVAGKGNVKPVGAGQFQWLQVTADRITMKVATGPLQGNIQLCRAAGEDAQGRPHWTFTLSSNHD